MSASRVHRLVDIRVICDVPSYVTRGDRTPEEREKSIQAWVREFQEFMRDHRSQDPVSLSVEPQYEDQCSECERVWETYDEDGKTYCINCGAEVEEKKAAPATP